MAGAGTSLGALPGLTAADDGLTLADVLATGSPSPMLSSVVEPLSAALAQLAPLHASGRPVPSAASGVDDCGCFHSFHRLNAVAASAGMCLLPMCTQDLPASSSCALAGNSGEDILMTVAQLLSSTPATAAAPSHFSTRSGGGDGSAAQNPSCSGSGVSAASQHATELQQATGCGTRPCILSCKCCCARKRCRRHPAVAAARLAQDRPQFQPAGGSRHADIRQCT